MRFLGLSTILALVSTVLAEQDSSYNFTSGSRPDNVTGLDYDFYATTGSYYNGSLTVKLQLTDPIIGKHYAYADDDDNTQKNPCAAHINGTIETTIEALAGITMPSTDTMDDLVDGQNPIRVQIWGWTQGTNLSNLTVVPNFYHSSGSPGPDWSVMIGDSSPSQYTFSGNAVNGSIASDPTLSLDLTEQCRTPGSSILDPDTYLYAGTFINPFTGNQSALKGYPWTNFIPDPSMTGEFDNSSAQIDLTGLFQLFTNGHKIVGQAYVSFSGNLDSVRSDQLLLGQTSPEWIPTVGFTGKSLVPNGGERVSAKTGFAYLAFLLLLTFYLL